MSAGGRRPGLRPPALLAVTMVLMGVGCATERTTSRELLQLPEDAPANRAMQTRRFETPSSDELLSASAAVLQDLGFQVTESTRELGFLRAAKERSAREYGQESTRVIVALVTAALSVLGGANATYVMPVDLQQQINASLVAQPLGADETEHEVRIMFYRLVWKSDGSSGDQTILPGEQRMEMIRDPEIYQRFFASLGKAVFLEAHAI